MSLSIRLRPEPVRSLAAAVLTGVYAGVGTSVENPVRIFLLQNLTDVILMFSFDGIDDHFPLASNGYVILDVTANRTREDGFFISEGDRLYVKEIAGNATTGGVYFTTFYGSN